MSVGLPFAQAREVVYRAPDECPDRDEVIARIDARAPTGGPARIDVTKTDRGFHGELVVGEGEKQVSRSVDAQTCGAVVEALSLVVALSHDDESGPIDPAPPPAKVTTDTSEPPPDADAGRPLPPPPRKTRWSIGHSFALGSGSIEAMNGLTFFVGALGAKPLFDFPIFEPSARVGLGFTFPTGVGNAPVVRTATGVYCPGCGPVMTLVKQHVDLCPFGAGQHGSTVSFAICGRTELGVLVADNAGTTADAKARFWAAMGPIGRVRVFLTSGGVVRPFFEGEAGAIAILRRDRFHFDGYDTIVANPWAAVIAMNVGVVLP